MPEIKNENYKKFLKSVLIGTVAAVCITIFLLFTESLVITVCGIPLSFASAISSIALAIGTLCGGMISALKNGKNGMICGVITAVLLFIIITVVGLIVKNSFSVISLIHLTVTVLSGCIGGILGVNKTEKRKII